MVSSAAGDGGQTSPQRYDVVICGGGLAGLTLARQLKLELPAVSLAVIDRLARPLPEAAHKVGEATSELAAAYFGTTLQLQKHLTQRHFLKLGLRFFLGDAGGPFEKRPELGLAIYPPLPTWQIDRGRLENDLRQLVVEMGVHLLEDTFVDDIQLADGDDPHVVLCRRSGTQQQERLFGRWVIDALGRRRLLQSKLNLGATNGHLASAAWWRIEPRIDIADLTTDADAAWRNRVFDDRNMSTNHLIGYGYWVWLIPLASEITSIGIVTDETIHPVNSYGRSYQQAMEWLERYEPALWRLLKDRQPLDFHRFKNFSYHARQLFSRDRWACVGEAGVFLDPLYSIGSDLIGVENTITTEMIRRDLKGELSRSDVEDFNRFVLDLLVGIALGYYKDVYRTFGHPHIYAAKLTWDTLINQTVFLQVFVQDIVRRPFAGAFDVLRRYKVLHERVQRLLIDWAEAAPARSSSTFSDPIRIRFLQLTYLELATRRTPAQYLTALKLNLARLEELAQLFFWKAVEECLPEHVPKNRKRPPWINAWKISLCPERWEAEGLFDPWTKPRSLQTMRHAVAGTFGPYTWQEYLRVALPYRLYLIGRGRLMPRFTRLLIRFLEDKPALWLRRLFVADYPAIPVGGGDLHRLLDDEQAFPAEIISSAKSRSAPAVEVLPTS
jgi:flavin-dependent dehydrogenase